MLGARSKYVDVLNPGGTTGHSAAAPPPPSVPMMVPVMPTAMTQPKFFVPQQPGELVGGGARSVSITLAESMATEEYCNIKLFMAIVSCSLILFTMGGLL